MVFPFSTYLEALRQFSAACKALQILKSGVLKRLASAIQLRPLGTGTRVWALALARISLQSYGFSPKVGSSIRLQNTEPAVVGSFGLVKRFVRICKRSQNSEPAVGCSLRVSFPLSPPFSSTRETLDLAMTDCRSAATSCFRVISGPACVPDVG